MPPTIAPDLLPTPAFIEIVDDAEMLQTAIENTRMPRWHDPDPDVRPVLLRAGWHNCRAEVADAIRRKYDEHPNAVFLLEEPRQGQPPHRVIFTGRPVIQWANAVTAASVTAEFESALAYE